MLWLLFLALISTVFSLCFLITWIVLRWKYGREISMNNCTCLCEDEPEVYKYIVAPLPGQQFQNGIPKIKSLPVNVQPNRENLDLRLFTMWANATPDNQGNSISPETYQTPLISNYDNESDMKNSPVWRTIARRSLEGSYKQTFSPKIDTATATITPLGTETETQAGVSKHEQGIAPELSFSIFYDAPSKDLHVTVLHATGLAVPKDTSEDTRHALYFRVNARVEPCETEWRGTRTVCATKEPSFAETFIVSGLVHHKLRECRVHFVVIDLDEYTNCWKVVGEVTQSLIDCRANQLMKVTKKLHQGK